MAEARAEEEEDALRRRDGGREQVVRRPPSSSGGHPDRRKPEHRHSQGPLSSIRAVIKRTTRPVSVAETPRDQERDQDRDRDRDRDRRRPQITILSAEPLPSTSWFPGAAAGIPPPPPPPAQVWGPAIHPSVQPPPSYEEVIREKTQEQVLLPSSSSTCPVSRTTIATQTDPGSAPDPQGPRAVRPARPPRPPLPNPLKSSAVDDVTRTNSQSAVPSSDAEGVASNPRPPSVTHNSTSARCCDLLTDLCSPSTSTCGAQTDQSDQSLSAAAERPRPRPRTKLGRRPISNKVKVQTLVKLREDGLATLAARASSGGTNPEERQGKYLQELLEAFSCDDWGLPDQRSDSGEGSQSESEEEEQQEEDMAALRARIQAFEQHGSCRDADDQETGPAERCAAKRPEPRPRPRLQGQPAKSAPPAVAPKPKNLSPGPKPSSKEFWEGDDVSAEPENTAEGPSAEPSPSSEPQPCRTTAATPKPQPVTETPIPAPRPAPPKTSPSPTNPRPPPRPAVAPRARPGAPQQDQSSVEAGGGAESSAAAQSVKGGSIRSNVQTKPAATTSTRRASAPNLAPKPTAVPPARPDPDPVPARPPSAASAAAPKPSVPAKPPTPAPTPATRKGPVTQTKAEPASPPNPKSSDSPPPPRPTSAKLLPPSSSRPPPIKSAPERPPPPVIDSAPAANQSPASKAAPAPSTPPAGHLPSSQTAALSAVTTNQTQRVAKKGPPLPPRPQLGHPLYNNYTKQDVLIVLDDPAAAPSEVTDPTTAPPLITPSQSPLDQDPQPEPVQDQDSRSKPALEGQSNQQSILSEQPAEQKEQPEPPPVSGPRCIALFDYDGEKDDELTFSQGDLIALLELVDEAWGRGQIHGRVGIFPLNFTEVLEPLPAPVTSSEATDDAAMESSAALKPSEEWVVALFDFPGQTAEDLSFHRGALIQVLEHVDAEWRRGRLEGREGLYPAAFTQPRHTQLITDGLSAAKDSARALFDFTAEGQDELTLKVGDIITQVESVDEQWILGVVDGRRGIVPKNYISFL